MRRTNASHRARLRVELGRLRHELRPLAQIRATAGGFALAPRGPGPNSTTVRLLLPPIESPDAAVLALLADGEAWSTSALALALGSSQRTAQRALAALETAGQVRALGPGPLATLALRARGGIRDDVVTPDRRRIRLGNR